MKAAYLWPIERIDAAGEPDKSGDFVKLGLRRPGETSTIWIDRFDAEALVEGIRAILAGMPAPGDIAPTACERCARDVAVGEYAYQVKPGGARCLICQACAPTVSEEVAAIMRALEAPGARLPPDGFKSRPQAIAWLNRVRGTYNPRVKRLSRVLPLEPPAIETDLEFKDPPETAIEVKEEDFEDDR